MNDGPKNNCKKPLRVEMKTEKSAKDISADLAKQSGWNKKEIYALINQNKEWTLRANDVRETWYLLLVSFLLEN